MSRFVSLLCLLVPLCAAGSDLEFAGGLERVTAGSILIRLADGKRIDAKLPKTGPLASTTISAQYKLADEVQITCKPMGDHCLDLKSIKFLRASTPKERALVLGTPMPSGPQQPELEHARQVNLDRAANMPSFVADETAKRYTSPRKASPPEWKLVDTVESEIAFKGNEPIRQHIRINGKAWNKPNIPGVNWSVEFGTEIKPVFNLECPTEIAFEGRQETHGKSLLAYLFTSPPDGCFSTANSGAKHYTPAVAGRVLVEDPGGSMIQYEENSGEFPKEFAVQSFKQTIFWDNARIGDTSYLLPAALDFFVGFSNGDPWHVSVEYKNHRRFEASTSVTFH